METCPIRAEQHARRKSSRTLRARLIKERAFQVRLRGFGLWVPSWNVRIKAEAWGFGLLSEAPLFVSVVLLQVFLCCPDSHHRRGGDAKAGAERLELLKLLTIGVASPRIPCSVSGRNPTGAVLMWTLELPSTSSGLSWSQNQEPVDPSSVAGKLCILSSSARVRQKDAPE